MLCFRFSSVRFRVKVLVKLYTYGDFLFLRYLKGPSKELMTKYHGIFIGFIDFIIFYLDISPCLLAPVK